jgi:hypothetical protein
MRIRLAAALSVLLALPAGAADFGRAAIGTAGSEFLLFDTSARGIAMGGSYAAAVDDASAIYWNPAGLARVPRLSATVMHAQYLADITYNSGAIAGRINDSSVLAAGIRYVDAGSIGRTDINGINRGSFQPRSYVAELGWGQSIYDLSDSEMDVSMGVTARYLHTDLDVKAHGYGGDFGVQSRFYGSARTYDVALALQNLGVGQKFDQVRDTLPTRLRFGGGMRPYKPLLLTVEAIMPINNSPHAAAGMEWSMDVEKSIKGAVRAGINTLTYESLGLTSMLSFGVGLSVSDLTFDYAFAPTGELGATLHRVSISFNLPAKISRRYRER